MSYNHTKISCNSKLDIVPCCLSFELAICHKPTIKDSLSLLFNQISSLVGTSLVCGSGLFRPLRNIDYRTQARLVETLDILLVIRFFED